ncbi:MAG: PLP-dependent aminotransferase family protein [Leptospirales bacterium]
MGSIFSDRITDVPKSFIREILKVTNEKDIISFAGGLPNRKLFPVEELKKATLKVFENEGRDALQYNTSEGDLGLRKWIVERYSKNQNIDITPENIIITTGSQQGLDLLGKTILNENDNLIIEEPGYLGAIQAFSLYRPRFHPVPVNENGMNLEVLKQVIENNRVKLCYTVPNFQNPSGITYTDENREQVANIIGNTDTILIEDNPYGDLRFKGSAKKSFFTFMPKNTVLLGSFSKTIVPSFRIGWLVADESLIEKLIIAKQASDLHTNYFCQKVICHFLEDADIDAHIRKITESYGKQRDSMVQAIRKYFPDSVQFTQPEGGMFLWVSLPAHISAIDLFHKAVAEKIAFVPGDPFYINKTNVNTLRLNYSCVDEETIEKGIRIMGKVLQDFI